jgi:hypothetical protein
LKPSPFALRAKKPSISLMSSETDLSRNQAIQNQRNSFSRGFPLPFNVETLQAFGALFQIPQYYRKFLFYKTKMLCNYVINISSFLSLDSFAVFVSIKKWSLNTNRYCYDLNRRAIVNLRDFSRMF